MTQREMELRDIRTAFERLFVHQRQAEKRVKEEYGEATKFYALSVQEPDRDPLNIDAAWLANAIAALLRAERDLQPPENPQ